MKAVSGRRRIAGAAIGNFAELYDYFVYGFSAPVLAFHFFPQANPAAALMGTFAVFAIAFFMRPVGGLVFGYLGDRMGRINVLAITVLLMGVATMAIGLLPTYTSVGLLAPALLLLCRLAQGFSHGGESSGSYSYTIESAPDGQRARWVSIVACFAFLPAAITGILILGLRAAVGDDAYENWAWRLPFILGGVLAAVGLWLRRRLDDPEEFTEAAREKPMQNPIRSAVSANLKSIVIVTLLVSVQAVAAYLILGYMYTFLVKVAGLGNTVALLSNAVAIVAMAFLMPVFGVVADRMGRKPVLFAGAAWLAVTSYPAFKLAASGTVAGAYGGQLLIAVGVALFASAGFTVMLELFPTAVRYTGHAIAYNIGNAIFGGTAPLIATALVSGLGTPLAPAYYVIAIAVFGLLVIIFTPETKDTELRSSLGARRSRTEVQVPETVVKSQMGT
ncbi:MFS transporter [Rhodococcus pseudokoreensis]|uniref:MFS transporter n=1 Tax=Rhodococcus pseudokoreensis TaxID=2811421 RepID=A0A974ZWJ8_9NOCA|nr:MFS transporter [Rhodococcus pseudokoreensis]QSE92980.1 MFS transporter [Rhodococcus pseudokoreensis]